MSAFTGDMHADRARYAPDHESLVAKKVAADAAPAQGRARRHLRTLVALQAGVLSALVFWVARRHLANEPASGSWRRTRSRTCSTLATTAA